MPSGVLTFRATIRFAAADEALPLRRSWRQEVTLITGAAHVPVCFFHLWRFILGENGRKRSPGEEEEEDIGHERRKWSISDRLAETTLLSCREQMMSTSRSGDIIHLNVGGKSLLSGRISTLKDETGAIFIDRDPSLFATILNFLRTKELYPRSINVHMLMHEAEFYGITPLVRKLQLCDELDRSSCGNVLFNGYLPPVYPAKRRNRHSVAGSQFMAGRAAPAERAPVRRSNTMPPNLGNSGILGRVSTEERTPEGSLRNRHGADHLWSSQLDRCGLRSVCRLLQGALNAKVMAGSLGDNDKMVAVALNVPVEALFFVGNQLIATSHAGKNQDVVPISSYDTAGSFLILGCNNGSIYYIDVVVCSGDSGNWIEIAYGTSSGSVRVIVQHPETVGSGPQLFQTFSVHRSPVTKIMLSEKHLISVCADNNHVRTWTVTRFRGMISTQPGSTPLTSFKILSLDDVDGHGGCSAGTEIGPYGERDDQQVFIQRVVPDTDKLYVRLSSNGKRCCEGSSRIGSRPRRYLFSGHGNGSIQMWDLTTAMEIAGKVDIRALGGPTEEELLELLDQCDLALTRTPDSTPRASTCSLYSQIGDVLRMERLLSPSAGGHRGGGASGSSASLCGSLPRQAPPPVPLCKPAPRDSAPSGAPQQQQQPQQQPLAIPAYNSSPRPPRQREWGGSMRRGSFVERCQELAKGSEAAGGGRRSLAVCTELEARFGLRTPTTFSVSPGARNSPGTPGTPSSSSLLSLTPSSSSPSSSPHRKAMPTPPTSPAPHPTMSPTRSQAPASPRRGDETSPDETPASTESSDTPPANAGPPISPKPHMNETSF
ncbi:hypothetical protein F7725_021228 [Dissostichus mawsoni]|uniref:BTB domain-containing protein n=1 Tax=Dissostichus mawsoni TaxID=36200 RepID=A0A7J5YFM3_DISMA|nr:hypothetical protein F7725_021228 [Dissostichus mawsoni]